MSKMKHQHRPDRFTNPDQVGDRISEAVYHALAPLDRYASELENKWGVDRLPKLVTPQLAAKFGEQKALLDQAIDMNEPQQVATQAAAMMRGWQALDAAAAAGGQQLVVVEAWSCRDDDGNPIMICKTQDAAHAAAKQNPGVVVYNLEEVVRMIHAFRDPLLKQAKQDFPGAEVMAIGDLPPGGDAVPI